MMTDTVEGNPEETARSPIRVGSGDRKRGEACAVPGDYSSY